MKDPVWPFNLAAFLFIGGAASLSSHDPTTGAVAGAALGLAVGAGYFSLRRRFNLTGALLLLFSLLFVASFVSRCIGWIWPGGPTE